VIATITVGEQRGVLHDSMATGEAATAIFEGLCRGGGTGVTGEQGRVLYQTYPGFEEHCNVEGLSPRPVRLEQTNSTVPFGDRLMVKVFRQLEPGLNAELEVGAYLTQHARRGLAPRLLGSASYQGPTGDSTTLAVVHEFVPNEGAAWDLFRGHLDKLFEQALAAHLEAPPVPAEHLFDLAGQTPPAKLTERIAGQLRHARLLGQRTGELHVSLAAGLGPAFQRETFTSMHQQSLFQGSRALLARSLRRLEPAARRAARGRPRLGARAGRGPGTDRGAAAPGDQQDHRGGARAGARRPAPRPGALHRRRLRHHRLRGRAAASAARAALPAAAAARRVGHVALVLLRRREQPARGQPAAAGPGRAAAPGPTPGAPGWAPPISPATSSTPSRPAWCRRPPPTAACSSIFT
jgi:hypothetical protein